MSAVILGIALLVCFACWMYRERERDKREKELLDRIQAPEAVQIAAVQQAVATGPPAAPPPDVYDEAVPPSDDVRLLRDILEVS